MPTCSYILQAIEIPPDPELMQPWSLMVGADGFEPSTSCVSGKRSNQLSYAPKWELRSGIRKRPRAASNFGYTKRESINNIHLSCQGLITDLTTKKTPASRASGQDIIVGHFCNKITHGNASALRTFYSDTQDTIGINRNCFPQGDFLRSRRCSSQ